MTEPVKPTTNDDAHCCCLMCVSAALKSAPPTEPERSEPGASSPSGIAFGGDAERERRAMALEPESLNVGQLNRAVRDLRELHYQQALLAQGRDAEIAHLQTREPERSEPPAEQERNLNTGSPRPHKADCDEAHQHEDACHSEKCWCMKPPAEPKPYTPDDARGWAAWFSLDGTDGPQWPQLVATLNTFADQSEELERVKKERDGLIVQNVLTRMAELTTALHHCRATAEMDSERIAELEAHTIKLEAALETASQGDPARIRELEQQVTDLRTANAVLEASRDEWLSRVTRMGRIADGLDKAKQST